MIALIIILVGLAFAAQWYLSSRSLTRLYYGCRPERGVTEPDEPVSMITELHNGKRLPEFYLCVTEYFPKEAEIDDATLRRSPLDEKCVTKKFYLLPRQKLTARTDMTFTKRGRYPLNGAMITGGDFFGLKSPMRRYYIHNELVVLPRRASGLPRLNDMLGGFLGEVSVNRFIMPDPVLTIGVTEYTGREPLKDISWRNSARAGKLLVKKYDYTLEPSVTVLLNTEGPPDADALEECFSLARSVCELIEKKNIKYSFITNAQVYGLKDIFSTTDGLGAHHLAGILENLGRASAQTRCGFGKLVELAVKKAEQGRAHIVITPARNAGVVRNVDRLKALTGGGVMMVTPEGMETHKRHYEKLFGALSDERFSEISEALKDTERVDTFTMKRSRFNDYKH
jgi:uncharacterized protein (DUF58 family)